MSDIFDVIIIGAGHNGLTAAALLARKGKKVCVLESSKTIGGMSQERVTDDGVSIPRIAHLAYNLNPTVMKELGLAGKLKFKQLSTIVLSPDGKHVHIADKTAQFADGTPHPEAEAYTEIVGNIKKFAKLLAPMALKTPPDLSEGMKLSEVGPLAKLGINLKLMGKKDMREFLRILLSNIYDLALDDLEDGPLAGSLAADAAFGNWSGPRSPGTVLSLMYRYGAGGNMTLPIGGIGVINEALADAAKAKGAIIHTEHCVKEITTQDDQVTGVVLMDGSTLGAKAVMSSAGAFQSMMMVGPEHYDAEAVRRLRNVRAKGSTAKVNIVLNGIPEFSGLKESQLSNRLLIAPSAYYVEQAFNALKYGEMAKQPVIEAIIPSLSDASISNGSNHVLSAVVQYVPYYLEGGWTKRAQKQLKDIVIESLSAYAPNLKDKIVDVETLSPADIERETSAPGGHWHHGELSTDQMMTVRPVNLMARYAFGVKGLYLCGAGAHPGGDVSGVAGRNSALQLIKDGVLS